MDKKKHQILANWAISCAEHVLFYFEEKHPEDLRPRQAIEAARLWSLSQLKVSEARKFAFAAHAAARDAEDPKAIAAARSAGHAAAVAHVPGHARFAASYAVDAAIDPVLEMQWQMENTPKEIKSLLN